MDRIEVIQKILDKIKGNVYLEIGVEQGVCFLKINSEIKIGVDPLPLLEDIKASLNKNSKYFEMSSDEFFNNHKDIFEEYKIDVAFVDGLHEYKQSLKDVENCLKYLSKKGIIIIHDCNPSSKISATPANLVDTAMNLPEWNWVWSGDVWKTTAHLRSLRKDLNIFVLDCDYGLGIITKGKPEDMLNFSIKEIEEMSYFDLDKDRKRILNLKKKNYFYDFLEKLKVD